MKVLVVGGAGYVGGAVTDLLQQQRPAQHMTSVYDSLLYEESYLKPVSFYRGDVRDHARLLPHLQWADAVIWLAAVVGDAACALDPATAVEVNQESVRWLANNFQGRIVFLSTCSIYGASEAVLDESSPTNPLSVYASTKLAAESFLIDRNAIIFRLGTLFGLSDNYSRVRFDLVVNTLTQRAHQTGRITVFGGEQYRPLLHVRDAAETVVRALNLSATGVYNLSCKNMAIVDLADKVARNFAGHCVLERTPQKFEDNRNYRVSSAKATCDLGFNTLYSVGFGIREVKALLESGRLVDPSSPRYWNDRHLEGRPR
jgi:nucleoside-diphosphate-sugar epimerase